MKSDIVPYDPELAERLGQVLAKSGIPVFGPNTGIELLTVVQGIDKFIEERKLQGDMRILLEDYRNRILDICRVAAHQQRGVIDTLERMIKGT